MPVAHGAIFIQYPDISYNTSNHGCSREGELFHHMTQEQVFKLVGFGNTVDRDDV